MFSENPNPYAETQVDLLPSFLPAEKESSFVYPNTLGTLLEEMDKEIRGVFESLAYLETRIGYALRQDESANTLAATKEPVPPVNCSPLFLTLFRKNERLKLIRSTILTMCERVDK